MLFAGTAVANGGCRGIVNAIGMSTEVGAIQQQITDAAAEEEDTPLKKKLDVFGERLAQVSSLSANISSTSITHSIVPAWWPLLQPMCWS